MLFSHAASEAEAPRDREEEITLWSLGQARSSPQDGQEGTTTLSLILDAAPPSLALELGTQLGLTLSKLFISAGFVVVYQYSIEIYPAVARATGTAICLAAGRFGAILCPLVYEYIKKT